MRSLLSTLRYAVDTVEGSSAEVSEIADQSLKRCVNHVAISRRVDDACRDAKEEEIALNAMQETVEGPLSAGNRCLCCNGVYALPSEAFHIC